MIKIILVTFFGFLLVQCNSQIMAEHRTDKSPTGEGLISRILFNERVDVKFDYFGDLVLYPGMSFGNDHALTRTSQK